MSRKTPGAALALFRAAKGLTQRQVAEALGLQNPASISALETGKDEPSLELALRIQRWSGGEVRAADLRPDLADLLATAAEPAPAPASEGFAA